MTVRPDCALLWQEAMDHLEAQRFPEAEGCCRRLIACAPEQPLSYAMLSRLSRLRGLARATSLFAFEACKRMRGSPWHDHLLVGEFLRKAGETQLAREVLSLIDPHDGVDRDGLAKLARHFEALGDQPRARYCNDLAGSLPRRSRIVKVPAHT